MDNFNLPVEKSEILFLYESSYSVPNGDPFTSEQRYDEETKKVLVSDVRIKRFIRDYFDERGEEVYVTDPKEPVGKNQTGSGLRFRQLQNKFKDIKDPYQLLFQCRDARLFGAVVTLKSEKKKKSDEGEEGKNDKAFNVTGAVQFALLNPSLNKVDLRMHQNTSVFPSGEGKAQGAIGTTTVVPYSLNQIHGWINPFSAVHTNLKQEDISEMFKALWVSINNANTRSKSNQNSLLLVQIVYSDANKKLYGADRLIEIDKDKTEKQDEQIRNSDDYVLNFTKLKEAVVSPAVKQINFYTENEKIKAELQGADKFVWTEIL
jgi:CRISPR-associated protein Csh2